MAGTLALAQVMIAALVEASDDAQLPNATAGPIRNVSFNPAACVDDPTYFQAGEQFGYKLNWTACSNWTGYSCATGGWGVGDPAGIAYLVRACPVSCSDGPCNDDYSSRSTYDDVYDSYDDVYGSRASATECMCPIEVRTE